MKRPTRLLIRWGVVASTLAVLAACGLAALFARQPPSAEARARELAQAEHRWAARPFSRYRLVLRAASWCRTDVEVQNERIVQVFENSCPVAPLSVSDLFGQIAQLDREPDRVFCAPDGCECTEVRLVQADYDTQLGFPRSIRVRRLRATNWQGLWGYMLARGLPNCLTPRDIDVINVLSLEPMS
jgi:hypothetical protein